MNRDLVQDAVKLFFETLPLETTDINTESAKWHDLYSKECNLYGLIGKMTEDELALYKSDIEGLQWEIQFNCI